MIPVWTEQSGKSWVWKELQGWRGHMRTNEFSLGETKFHFQHWLLRFLFFLLEWIKAHVFIIKQSSQTVGNGTFPRRWYNKKKNLGNFECPNISPDPFSQATVPPQSKAWNSKYLTEHNHHVSQTQHAPIAVLTDYVKPLTGLSQITYAWAQRIYAPLKPAVFVFTAS